MVALEKNYCIGKVESKIEWNGMEMQWKIESAMEGFGWNGLFVNDNGE